MKKANKNKPAKKKEKDQHTMVLEQINSKIDLLVEGHHGQNEKFGALDEKINSLDEKVGTLEKGQKLTLEYLERIEAELHGELKTKISAKDFSVLEKRVSMIERKMRSRV